MKNVLLVAATFLLVVTTLMCAVGCDVAQPDAHKEEKARETQLAIAKIQTEAQVAIGKMQSDVQLAVIKTCLSKGMVPVIAGGNIDCKQVKQ